MQSNRLQTVKSYPSICTNHFFVYFLLLSILFFIFAGPAFGIRIVYVKHLFDITGKLNAPSDVAVSRDGLIYVVDGVNNQIKVFDHNGKLVSSFGRQGSGNGEFRSPLGIDIDRAGNIYIADSGNHRLQIFNRWGNYSAQIKIPPNNKKPADPTDVAVDDSRNRCYIVDNDNHHILVYDLATFELLDTYGSPGTDKRAFRYPFFITLNKEKYLYIVDVINTRVQVLNPEGLFVAFIGGWGVEKGEFFRPKGVAVDKHDRIFVSDSYMGVIQVFDSNGEFYAAVGDGAKKAVKKFKTPAGIFVGRDNRLYVVEMFANKVSVYHIESD